ncbi:hypothetical protein, partial [Mycobacterium tilburgii]|uniref:hypothetical protein n=1 Tax=Mycobacterium tilburgii TaxID=44467 RepID=UPI0016435812
MAVPFGVAAVVGPNGPPIAGPSLGVLGCGVVVAALFAAESLWLTSEITKTVTIVRVNSDVTTMPMISRRFDDWGGPWCGIACGGPACGGRACGGGGCGAG